MKTIANGSDIVVRGWEYLGRVDAGVPEELLDVARLAPVHHRADHPCVAPGGRSWLDPDVRPPRL